MTRRRQATPTNEYRRALAIARASRTESSRRRSYELLKQAIYLGDPWAEYALATTWYLHGVTVGRDFVAGARLLASAAKAGVVEAQFDLAVCYETGKGRAKSL